MFFRPHGLRRAALVIGACLLSTPSLWAIDVLWSDQELSVGQEAEFVELEVIQTQLGSWNFAVGHAENSLAIGSLEPLDLGSHVAGVMVGGELEPLTDDFGHQWIAWGKSAAGDVKFLASVVPDGSGQVVVCGTGAGAIDFGIGGDSHQQLEADAASPGFIAIYDPTHHRWERVFRTPGMSAEKLVSEQAGTVVVSGDGMLAAKFRLSGERLWSRPTPQAARPFRIMDARAGRPLLVALELLDGGASDAHLRVYRLDPATGAVMWERSASGPGRETPQALILDDQDGALLVFEGAREGARWSDSRFNTDYKKATAPRTLLAVRLQDTGLHGFKGQLGGGYLPLLGNAPTTLTAAAGYWDADARSFCLPLNAQGYWLIGGSRSVFDYTGVPTLLQIPLVGMLGGAEECRITNGGGEIGDIYKLDGDRALVVGRSGQGGYAMTGTVTKVDQPVRYTMSIDFDRDDPVPGLNLLALRLLVSGVGGVIYSEVDFPQGESPVVAVTFVANRSAARVLSAVEGIVLEREATLKRSSYDPSLTWALPMIASGDPSATGYSAPVTTHGTRLYLIDTSVSFSAEWSAQNQNLTVAQTRLIRGTNDPTTAVAFDHGTEMLSLVVDHEYGLASSTQVELVNYDVFPTATTSSVSLLAKAIIEAVKYQRAFPGKPGVICMAVSTETATTSYVLESAVKAALAEGLTVFVSAGNLGLDAARFPPASYGSMDGVVCVGAHDSQGALCSFSNKGTAVDLLAPGLAVPAISPGSSGWSWILDIDGTSPATALTAAAGLIHLGNNPSAKPADVEAAIMANSLPGPLPTLPLLGIDAPREGEEMNRTGGDIAGEPTDWVSYAGADQVTLSTATAVSLEASAGRFVNPPAAIDSDGDGIADVIETFHGLAEGERSDMQIALDPESGLVSLRFPMDLAGFDLATPFQRKDGLAWRIQSSTNGTEWTTPVGSLSTELDADLRLWVTAVFPSPGPRCLVRLEVVE